MPPSLKPGVTHGRLNYGCQRLVMGQVVMFATKLVWAHLLRCVWQRHCPACGVGIPPSTLSTLKNQPLCSGMFFARKLS